jgi:hypothetical protein
MSNLLVSYNILVILRLLNISADVRKKLLFC